MPKGNHRGRSGGVDRTTTISGHHLYQVTAAATVASLSLSPLSLDQRLIEQSDEFQEFRFTSVKIRVFNEFSTALRPTTAVAYTPVVLGATPTYAQLPSLACFAVGNGFPGSPFPSFRVSKRELFTNAPRWFRRGTPYDDLLETQGTFYYGNNGSFATYPINVHISYTIELKARAEAALTSLRATALPAVEQELASALNMVPNPLRAAKLPDPAVEQKTRGSDVTVQAAIGSGAQRGTSLRQAGEPGGSREPPVDAAEESADGLWIRVPVDAKRSTQGPR